VTRRIGVMAICLIGLLANSYCLAEDSTNPRGPLRETQTRLPEAHLLQMDSSDLSETFALPLIFAEAAGETSAEPGDDAEQTEEKPVWEGSVEAGLQIREGNTESTDMYGRVKALRTSGKHELTLSASYDYAELESETNTNRAFGQCGYRLHQWERAYLFAVLNAEHDEIEDLKLRLNASAGPGYRFIDTEKTKLLGEFGVGATAEWYDSRETGSEQTTEGILWLHGEWTTKVFDRSTFSQVLTVFPSVTDIGSVRVVSDTSLTTPLSQKLDLRISVHDEYDNDPEVSGVEKNDLTFRTTVVYTF
jgi:putative salt-induced outer membrane protein YdiY